MGMFDRFKRRNNEDMSKKTRAKTQPVYKLEEVKVEDTPVVPEQEEAVDKEEHVEAAVDESGFDQLDLAVAKLMGTYNGADAPKPYSTDKNLVMDMVTFARENKIKLPLFTSDPTRIAKAIEKWGKQ